MAARNAAAEKATGTSQADRLKLVIICSVPCCAGERSPNSEAITLPPFRSRPFDRRMKIKKN